MEFWENFAGVVGRVWLGGFCGVDDCGFSTLFNGEYVCFHGI